MALFRRTSDDPKGVSQDLAQNVQDRYESQQGPLMNQAALNYGRASEADWNSYNDIMSGYRNVFSGQPGSAGGGGGGGGGYSVQGKYTPFKAGYKDPFNSYGGYTEFSKTGGYSAQDIANMRARGISPIRAAYANAEREIGRQRALQGGYSPNAIATQALMAREQGQGMADATQNVEGELAVARNQGRLAGLGGMSNIEGQRLSADVDVSKYNATAQQQAQAANLSAAERAAASRASARAASSAQSAANQMEALQGARLLYGTNPAMTSTFGNQAINLAGQGGEFGLNLLGRTNEGQQLPGKFDQTMGRIGSIVDIGSKAAYPWLNDERQQKKPKLQPSDFPWQGPQQPAPRDWSQDDQYAW